MMRPSDHDRAWRAVVALAAGLSMAAPARAATPLSAALAPLGFLVGDWIGDNGHAQGSQTVRGRSSIEPVADGSALLRRDQTTLLDRAGHVTQSFEQIMMIYPENGHVHGDYFDGTHAIHYLDAVTTQRGTVVFVTATTPDMPAFRLTYTLTAPARISIRFEMRAPGTGSFHVIAEGTAHRAA